jgi:hypothetical protein
LTEERMAKIGNEEFAIEIPLALPPGAAMLNLTLTNAADGAKVFKKAKLDTFLAPLF